MNLTRELQIALAVWTAEVARAKRAYYRDLTDEQQDIRRAKAVRKSHAQQAYRDRQKEARP